MIAHVLVWHKSDLKFNIQKWNQMMNFSKLYHNNPDIHATIFQKFRKPEFIF